MPIAWKVYILEQSNYSLRKPLSESIHLRNRGLPYVSCRQAVPRGSQAGSRKLRYKGGSSLREECHFRISSCNPMDENVKYINALGTSTLEKYTISLETDISWYVPITPKALKSLRFETEQKNGYIRIVKETMDMSVVSEEEFRNIKANRE